MPRPRRIAWILVVAAAALAAFVPRSASLVERSYSHGAYPAIQAALTTASNTLPFAVFDLMLVAVVGLVCWWGRTAWRDRHRTSAVDALWTLTRRVVTLAAVTYLWFLGVWGLNYARPPIEQRLGLAAGAATTREVRDLLETAIAKANDLYLPSRAEGFVPYRAEDDVARALHLVEAAHGRPSPTMPATPKPTLLAPYFRMAGVDGLTAPAALETLLNPDLTARERPFTLAHEWAHLSGAAPEADANFMAWLVTQAPGTWAHTQYSGWLFVVSETAAQVPAEARRASLAALADGPRRDLADIARRQQSRVDLVERIGWRVYDSYLKSQGVGEGVRSYSRVVELIVRSRRTPAGNAVPQ